MSRRRNYKKNNTTACSRQRYKLESEGKISTIHCTRNGNYESLQCDSGVCWCVEPKTGRIVNGTKAVPQALWTQLPCCKRSYERKFQTAFFSWNDLLLRQFYGIRNWVSSTMWEYGLCSKYTTKKISHPRNGRRVDS